MKKGQESKRTQRALRKIRKHRPKSLLEASKLGLLLIYAGSGSFRSSYRIAETTLLIKFPIMEQVYRDDSTHRTGDLDGKRHTRAEVRKIRALREFKSLRSHLPPIYYYNSRDGVVVTKYFTRVPGNFVSKLGPMLSGLIKELTGVTLADLFGDNIRLDKSRDRLMIVDLGY